MYYLKLVESNCVIKDVDKPLEFKSYQKANEERIYLQPDIEERIIIEENINYEI